MGTSIKIPTTTQEGSKSHPLTGPYALAILLLLANPPAMSIHQKARSALIERQRDTITWLKIDKIAMGVLRAHRDQRAVIELDEMLGVGAEIDGLLNKSGRAGIARLHYRYSLWPD